MHITLKNNQERELFFGGRHYRNKVRIVITNVVLYYPKEIK